MLIKKLTNIKIPTIYFTGQTDLITIIQNAHKANEVSNSRVNIMLAGILTIQPLDNTCTKSNVAMDEQSCEFRT